MRAIWKKIKKPGCVCRSLVLALVFMLSISMVLPQQFGAAPVSAAVNGTITVTDSYTISGSAPYGSGVNLSIEVKVPDGSDPITNPNIVITASGMGSTGTTYYFANAEYMVMDPATKTYLEENGFTVTGTNLATGYTLTRSTPINTKLEINNLKFFWPNAFPEALKGDVPKGTYAYLRLQSFHFELRNGSATLNEATKLQSCTGPSWFVSLPHVPIKSTIAARDSVVKKNSDVESKQITYDYSFDLKNSINGVDVTSPQQDADGVRYFRVQIALPGNMSETSTNNYFGNTSLGDYGTLGCNFANSSGWVMVGEPTMFANGNSVYIEIYGKMNNTDPAEQEAHFDVALTFTAKDPKVGNIPAASVMTYRDYETASAEDLAAWGTTSPATYRSLFRSGGSSYISNSTFIVRRISADSTMKDFQKHSDYYISPTGTANDIINGNGIKQSYYFAGKAEGQWRNMNGDWIEDLFFVDEERGTSIGNSSIWGVDTRAWAQKGYDPHYFGDKGIQEVYAGSFRYLDNDSWKNFPVTVYVRVKNKETGEYFNPKTDGSLTTNWADKNTFTQHGNGNYWPVMTTSSYSNYLYMSAAQIFNAFGIPAAEHKNYVVNGAVWDLSSNGKYGSPLGTEYAAPESLQAYNDPSITLLALIENPTPEDIEQLKTDSAGGIGFLKNEAKIFYFPYVRGEVPIPPIIGGDEVVSRGGGYVDEILRANIQKEVSRATGPSTFSPWTKTDTTNSRYEEKMYWKIKLTNEKTSDTVYRSLSDGKIVFYDPWYEALRNVAYPNYTVKAYLTGPGYGTAVDPAYNGDYEARGAIDVSDYVSITMPPGTDVLVYTVDLMKIPQNERTAAMEAGFDFTKKGLKPESSIILLYETDLKDPDKDQPRAGQTCFNYVYSASDTPIVNKTGTESYTDYNGNGNKTDDYVSSSASFRIFERNESTEIKCISINKKVSEKPRADAGNSDYDKNKTVEKSDTYSYWLTITSEDAASPLKNIVIEDTLPMAGDGRGSQWAPQVTAAQLLTDISATLKLGSTPQNVTTGTPGFGQWKLESTSSSGYVTHFKLTAPASLSLSENSISLNFDVKVPGNLNINGSKAVNLMRVTADAGNNTQHDLTSTATVQLRIPQSSPLSVEKLVSGKQATSSVDADYLQIKDGLAAGDMFSYQLKVSAGLGELPITDLIIADTMPAVGDEDGSQWVPQVTASDLLSALHNKMTIGSTKQQVVSGSPTAAAWGLTTTTSGGYVTGFTLKPPTSFAGLSSGQSLIAKFDVKVPEDMRTHGAISVNTLTASGKSGEETYDSFKSKATAIGKKIDTMAASVSKHVAPVSDTNVVGTYTKSPANQIKGATISYKLSAKNTGESRLDHIVITDILPYSGDKYILPPYESRDSAWKLGSFDGNSISIKKFSGDLDTTGTEITDLLGDGWILTIEQPPSIGNGGGSLMLTAPESFALAAGERIEVTFKAVLPEKPENGKFSLIEVSQGTNSFIFEAKGYENAEDSTGKAIAKEDDVTLGILNIPTRTLTVSKVVAGEYGDRTKEFAFTLTVKDEDKDFPVSGTTLNYVGGSISGSSQTAKPNGSLIINGSGQTAFTLKHDQKITISDIPAGGSVQVVETTDSNYTTDISGSVVKSSADTGVYEIENKDAAFHYSNTRELVPTGIMDGVGGWMLIAIPFFTMAALVGVIYYRRKGLH